MDISSWMIYGAAFGPQLFNFVLENSVEIMTLVGMSQLDDGWKSLIRSIFAILALLAKFIEQYKKPQPKENI